MVETSTTPKPTPGSGDRQQAWPNVPTPGLNGRQNNPNRKVAAFKAPTKFRGRIEALQDFVYDKSGSKQRQAEQYNKTTTDITNYLARKGETGGNDICITIEGICPMLIERVQKLKEMLVIKLWELTIKRLKN